MSTSIYVFGQLTVPEDRQDALRASKLTPAEAGSFFGQPFAGWTVGLFLKNAAEYGMGLLRVTFEGEEVTIRAALGEDLLVEWAGAIGAFVRAAAAAGGRGEILAVERTGDFGHRLLADGKKAKESALSAARLKGLLQTPACREIDDLLEAEAANAKKRPKADKAPAPPSDKAPSDKAPADKAPADKAPAGKAPAAALEAQSGKGTVPPGIQAASELRADPGQAARFIAAANGEPNGLNRNVAAEALVRAGIPEGLVAVAKHLEGADWRGGPFAHLSIAALFKLDPAAVIDRLKPFVTAQKKDRNLPSLPVLNAFELLVMGPRAIGLPDLDLPEDLVALDPRWLDLAAELADASFAALKGLPKKLLAAHKGAAKAGKIKATPAKAPKSASAKAEASAHKKGYKPLVLKAPQKAKAAKR